MTVLVSTKIALKPGTADKARAIIKEVAPKMAPTMDGFKHSYYAIHRDQMRAWGVWESADKFNAWKDGGGMGKAMETFKEIAAGPPEQWVHELFHDQGK